MTIQHHTVKEEAVRSLYNSAIERRNIYVERFKNGEYHIIINVFNLATSVFEYAAALKENGEILREHLNLVIDAGVVLYKTALFQGRTIAVLLQGQEYKYTVEERNYKATFQGFIAAFHAAIIGQRKTAINALGALNLDRLDDKAFTSSDEYAKRYALFLQRLYEKDEPHLQQLLEVSNAINEKDMNAMSFDYALRIVGPQVNLFTSLLTNDQGAFNKELPEALTLHAKYYTQTPEDALASTALTSVALSAIKQLALTQGFTVQTSSDYLTEVLFKPDK